MGTHLSKKSFLMILASGFEPVTHRLLDILFSFLSADRYWGPATRKGRAIFRLQGRFFRSQRLTCVLNSHINEFRQYSLVCLSPSRTGDDFLIALYFSGENSTCLPLHQSNCAQF